MTGTITAPPALPMPGSGEERVSNTLGRVRGKIGALTSVPPIRLVRYVQGVWGKRSLAQVFYEARLALGQSMYRSGIDDGQLGAQISDLDERINRAKATQAPSKALKLQQEKLILQLADAALAEEGPLPGADMEYQKARKAEAALAEIQSE